MSNYFDIGSYSRPLSTSVTDALTWFNRGLTWCYAFNQEEAVRCFEKVIELDPGCAMGYWGIAHAVGPFYNKPWEWYGEDERKRAIAHCHEYAQKASALKQQASAVEQALIDALCAKHPAAAAENTAMLENWTRDYAVAMRRVYRDFGDRSGCYLPVCRSVSEPDSMEALGFKAGCPREGRLHRRGH